MGRKFYENDVPELVNVLQAIHSDNKNLISLKEAELQLKHRELALKEKELSLKEREMAL
jgi:hypothetical protein